MNTAPVGSSGVESPGSPSYSIGQKAYARSEIRDASFRIFIKKIYIFYINIGKPVFNNRLKYHR